MSDDIFVVEKILKRRKRYGKVRIIALYTLNINCNMIVTWFFLKNEYLLKWLGYPNSENQWEPEENLNCPELVNDFIISKGHRILCELNVQKMLLFSVRMWVYRLRIFAAARKTQANEIEYLMKWKDAWKSTAISSIEAKEKWPLELLKFLENHVSMKQRDQNQSALPFSMVETPGASGDAVKVWCKCWICLSKQCKQWDLVLSLLSF